LCGMKTQVDLQVLTESLDFCACLSLPTQGTIAAAVCVRVCASCLCHRWFAIQVHPPAGKC
jgi:hypothetical protein